MMKKWSLRLFLFFLSLFLVLSILFVILGGGFGETDRNAIASIDLPLIFAHRGIPSYPENGKTGIKESLDQNFRSLEVDIRSTKDKHLVLFHDANCKRLLGIDKRLKDLTLDEVQQGHIIRHNQESSDKVMTLTEMTDSFPQFNYFYLDIKSNSLSIAKQLLRFLERQQNPEKFLIASTNFLFLSYLRIQKPEVITVLEGFQTGKHWWYACLPKNFKPDFYACSIQSFDEEHFRFLKKHDLLKRKIIYGVKHQNFKEVLNYQVPNIVVDFHPFLVNHREIERRLKKQSGI